MEVQGTTSLSLMTQAERYGFIFRKINMMYLKLLGSGRPWLRQKHV